MRLEGSINKEVSTIIVTLSMCMKVECMKEELY